MNFNRFRHLETVLWPLAILIALALVEATFYAGHSAWRDPDTLMRLAIAHDMQNDGWQRPVLFMRENAPYGMPLHWSSLFFWAMLAAAKLLWFIPPQQALDIVGIITGPAIAFLALGAAYWAAWPILGQRLAAAFGLAVVFCPSFFIYSRAGTANHHALMVLIVLILLGAAIRVDLGIARYRQLAFAGLASGLGLWISFEAMPFIEVFWLYLILLWSQSGDRRMSAYLLYFGTFFCGASLAALLIDPPFGGYANAELDRISLPYIFAIGLQLGCMLLCRWLSPQSSWQRLSLTAVLGVVAIGIELAVFPAVKAGPLGQFNPFLRLQWMTTIGEMRPASSVNDLLLLLGNGIIGIFALMWMPISSRWKNALYLTGLFALGLLTCRYIRFSPYLWIAGTLAGFHALRRMQAATDAVAGRALRIPIALSVLFLIIGNFMLAKPIQWDPQKLLRGGPLGCAIQHVLPALDDPSFLKAHEASPIFVTSLDQSPELLYYTDFRTLAGDYHSDVQGINDSYLMMRDFGWNTAHSVVQDHGIEFLLLCPSLDRARYGTTDVQGYARLSTTQKEYRQPTFYTRIMDGTLPLWLTQRQWPNGVKTDLKLFQVVEPSP